MNRLAAVFLLCLLLTSVCRGRQRFRLMEWNVENLFDTIHCAGKEDGEFTPTGGKLWTSARYWAKLSRLCRTIAAVGGETPCDLVPLVEVENDSVLSHLVHRTKLWRMGYEYVATSSGDVRGINVALLFQPHRFRPVGVDTLRFPPLSAKSSPTRDALHVAGELTSGDTLDVYVLHFPSRRAGRPARLFREDIARRVRHHADSVFTTRQRPHIVLTGDFNAWYPEKSIAASLGAAPPDGTPSPHSFYILSSRLHAPGGIDGTYKYQGAWNRLDHFIVSGTLLAAPPAATLATGEENCRIADLPFLLQKEKSGAGLRPFRTYLGNYYQGGYSDHLPLVLDLFY